MKKIFSFPVVVGMIALFVISGCATMRMPMNEESFYPMVDASAPAGKPLEAFRFDQSECRHWAFNQMGGQPALDAIAQYETGSTVLGVLAGAAVGLAVGVLTRGRAPLAVAGGVIGGTSAAAGAAQQAEMAMMELRRRYTGAYLQCMEARGNIVPR
jgi:uncharacterized protein YcfJ